jgi:hypothetical protein
MDDQVVTRERLYELVWAQPMLKVAAEFKVSSSYMARVCALMNVPRPDRGYWAKLAVGQIIRKPALPEARPEDQLAWARDGSVSAAPRSLLKPPPIVAVPARASIKRHNSQHPLVAGAKPLFEAGRFAYWSKYLKPAKRRLIDLAVSKTGLDRALAFANALFWHLEDSGHRVVIAPQHQKLSRAAVDQHEVPIKNRDYSELWSPNRPTVVYVGTLAVGLTIIELSERADAMNIDGEYVRLDAAAERRKAKDPYHWRYTTRDFPSGRLCLQAYSPYYRAEWTKQWREAKGEDLNKLIPDIVKELIEATPVIAKLVEDAERKAELERQEWDEQQKQWEREEAESRAAEAYKNSRKQLLGFIDAWAEAKRINDFFSELTAHLTTLDHDTRQPLEHRLRRAKKMIGQADALRQLRDWRAPEEWLGADPEHDES